MSLIPPSDDTTLTRTSTEADPETLEVTADTASALYIWSEVPALLILQNIYFAYKPQVLIDVKYF